MFNLNETRASRRQDPWPRLVFGRLIICETVKPRDNDQSGVVEAEAQNYFPGARHGRYRCPIEIDLWPDDRRDIARGGVEPPTADATRESFGTWEAYDFSSWTFVPLRSLPVLFLS